MCFQAARSVKEAAKRESKSGEKRESAARRPSKKVQLPAIDQKAPELARWLENLFPAPLAVFPLVAARATRVLRRSSGAWLQKRKLTTRVQKPLRGVVLEERKEEKKISNEKKNTAAVLSTHALLAAVHCCFLLVFFFFFFFFFSRSLFFGSFFLSLSVSETLSSSVPHFFAK